MNSQCQPNTPKKEEYVKLARSFFNKGEYDKSFEFFNLALEIDPISPHEHFFIGVAYHKKGTLNKAMHHLEKAVILKQRRSYFNALAEVYLDKAKDHFENGNYLKAKHYSELCRKFSQNTQIAKQAQSIENIALEEQDKHAHPYKINVTDLSYKEFLGEGAFGQVYLGGHKEKEVAIKCLDFNEPVSHIKYKAERDIMLFLTESNAPNVVKLHAYAITDNSYILVIDYIDNGTLTDSLEKLTLTQQKKIMIGLSCAVNHLHENKIVHCDIKPDNVLLKADFVPTLCDFGLSYRKDLDIREKPVGSPLYFAPEILLGTSINTEATDNYSLSLIIWCIVAGKVEPFAACNNLETLTCWVAALEMREEIPATCPPNIKHVIEFGWLGDASKRLSAKQMLSKLREPEAHEVKSLVFNS